jgi:hypothetical protein
MSAGRAQVRVCLQIHSLLHLDGTVAQLDVVDEVGRQGAATETALDEILGSKLVWPTVFHAGTSRSCSCVFDAVPSRLCTSVPTAFDGPAPSDGVQVSLPVTISRRDIPRSAGAIDGQYCHTGDANAVTCLTAELDPAGTLRERRIVCPVSRRRASLSRSVKRDTITHPMRPCCFL